MQTSMILIVGIGLLTCIVTADAMCHGCWHENACLSAGQVWDARLGDFQFTYHCTEQRHGNRITWKPDIMSGKCIWQNGLVSPGMTMHDRNTCTTYRCVQQGSQHHIQMRREVLSHECRVNGSCKSNGKTWTHKCVVYRCNAYGNSWSTQVVRYLSGCISY